MAEAQNRWGAQTQGQARTTSVAIDEGLRAYMLRVYNYMGLGIAFTAIITLLMINNPDVMKMVATGPMKWVLFAAVLGLGFFSHKVIYSGSQVMAHGAYWLYCALWGAMISPMMYAFIAKGSGDLIFRALAITAVTFGAVSIFGYMTKKNLSAFATFFAIASIGLLVAMLVNAFVFKSTGMSLVVSCGVVLLFAAITAWETQEIKQMYIEGASGGAGEVFIARSAIFGAFLLYGSFVTLFTNILNILGIMRSD
jgi:uncharacterized protein